MDTTLVRTFLEVAATGSFVSASERLHVTQSAVSLRVQRLEDELGRTLFSRSRAGAELTPAGREFEHYALSFLTLEQQARQQIAIPEGFTQSLTICAQVSLWPRMGYRLLDRLRETHPTLQIRGEMGMPERLNRMLAEGAAQFGLMYTPSLRPGLAIEKVAEDELVLVAPWENPTLDLQGRYVFVDWGPEFVAQHASELPELSTTGLSMALGAMSIDFAMRRNLAAYAPARHVKRFIDSGQLHLVADAPRFNYPIYAIWRDDIAPEPILAARAALADVVKALEIEKESVVALSNWAPEA